METTDWHFYYQKLNKLDLLVRDRKCWENFNQVFMISAKKNDGVDDLKVSGVRKIVSIKTILIFLKRYLFSRTKPGKWQFSRNMVTDQMPKDIAMMCVREQMLEVLSDEVPYELDLVKKKKTYFNS
jgi:GTPase Era involved in 16S rRNA processing